MLYGAPKYENVYGYNGESYNPNIKSQYLRARYYNVATAAFLTRDSYLGEIVRPLTLNRYGYCLGNPVCYVDPSGESARESIRVLMEGTGQMNGVGSVVNQTRLSYALGILGLPDMTLEQLSRVDYVDGEKKNSVKPEFSDSTMNLIKQLEGKPFLRPRINADGSITIGYGYDFTENEDLDMFNKYLMRNNDGNLTIVKEMTIEEAEKTIKKAADKKGITRGLEKFINGEGNGNMTKPLILNQNQYDALFSYFYANGAYVFSDSVYNKWVKKGGEYKERAEARKKLKEYLIENNGNYDSKIIVDLFVESKGPNLKYTYENRRKTEANLFISE